MNNYFTKKMFNKALVLTIFSVLYTAAMIYVFIFFVGGAIGGALLGAGVALIVAGVNQMSIMMQTERQFINNGQQQLLMDVTREYDNAQIYGGMLRVTEHYIIITSPKVSRTACIIPIDQVTRVDAHMKELSIDAAGQNYCVPLGKGKVVQEALDLINRKKNI